VVYFQSSANGLQEGSEVLLGGVKVGSVVRMQLQFDPETGEKVIPVVIELSADRIESLTGDAKFTKADILSGESLQHAIHQRGLRARLMTKSVLTGQLYVDLDFFSDDPKSYTFPGETIDGLLQIPSTKNEIERVLDSIAKGVNKLSNIDFKEMKDNVARMINNVDELIVNVNQKVEDLDTKGISDRTKGTLDKADSALASVEAVVTDEKIKHAIASFDEAAAEIKNLVASIDDEAVNAVIVDAGDAIQKAGDALKEIEGAAANIAELTTPDAAVQVRLNRTLASIEEVSRSVKDLADYIKRNPNSILAGKKQP
jgi:paraquat-inducible protein B